MHVFDKQSQKWDEKEIPRMPTARLSPAVLCLPSALIVAGGDPGGSKYSNTVEVFKPDASQWYKTNPLPVTSLNMSFVGIKNEEMCYALGGYTGLHRLNVALQTSFQDLLINVVPDDVKSKHCKGGHWKSLPNTPAYRPGAAVLNGSLFAIGGNVDRDVQMSLKPTKSVFRYVPEPVNEWVGAGDLPQPRSHTTVAITSPTEILVIGGWNGIQRVQTVYKGTYQK